MAICRYDAGGGAGAPVASLTGSGGGGMGRDRRVTISMIDSENLGGCDPLTGEAKAAFVQARLALWLACEPQLVGSAFQTLTRWRCNHSMAGQVPMRASYLGGT